MSQCRSLHYRNAIYQGCMNEDMRRHGFGVLINDMSEVLLGFWSHDQLDGSFAFIGNDNNAYGSMKAGKLTGFNVIESEKLIVYGHFANNLLHGTAILRNAERVELMQYSRGTAIHTQKSMQFLHQGFLMVLSQQFPNQTVGLIEFMSSLAGQAEMLESVTFRQLRSQTVYKYYGFTDGPRKQGLGVKFKSNCLLSCGWYRNCSLEGLGRLYCNHNQIHDGLFSIGEYLEDGVIYTKSLWKYNIISTNLGLKSSESVGNPIQPIKYIRRLTHLHSVNYGNSYILFDRLVKVELTEITQQTKENETLKSRSPLKPEKQKSPRKMSTYLDENYSISKKILKMANELEALKAKDDDNDDNDLDSEMDDFFQSPQAMKLLNTLETASQRALSHSSSPKGLQVRQRNLTQFKKN